MSPKSPGEVVPNGVLTFLILKSPGKVVPRRVLIPLILKALVEQLDAQVVSQYP